MNNTEQRIAILSFLVKKRDNLMDDIYLLKDNVKVLDSAIILITEDVMESFESEILRTKTLASMYLERESLRMKILEQESILKFFLDEILKL